MPCEVKPRAVLLNNRAELMPKFRAARAYCRDQGWEFKIFDEARIRTPYLYTVQFLWRYRHSSSHRNVEEVVEALRPYDTVTLREAVDDHFTSGPARGDTRFRGAAAGSLPVFPVALYSSERSALAIQVGICARAESISLNAALGARNLRCLSA